jgi:uncharacterized protein DUF6544
MLIIISLIILIGVLPAIKRIGFIRRFRKEVELLFSQSKNISNQSFSYRQLEGLPDPVQRYFRHVLKIGQTYISYVRVTHGGQFKTGLKKDWINIHGEQYATTEKPGFIWQGTTSMFTARDMFIADKGRLVVSLFSIYNVVDARGEQYDQGELLRWLGESVLYPTNLLPGERLQWFPIDFETAKLTFKYNNLSLSFIITFNEIGEITQMQTKRYMDQKNLEVWIIKCGAYKEMNNVVIPMAFEVLWRLRTGDFSYANFVIETIEYNIPLKLQN